LCDFAFTSTLFCSSLAFLCTLVFTFSRSLNTNTYTQTHKNIKKIEAVFSPKDHAKDSMSKAGASGGVRLQMAESGHEDEHANLLGDEGMRPGGGQVLKLGYPSTNLIPNSFFFSFFHFSS